MTDTLVLASAVLVLSLCQTLSLFGINRLIKKVKQLEGVLQDHLLKDPAYSKDKYSYKNFDHWWQSIMEGRLP